MIEQRRWETTETFQAACLAVDALQHGVKILYNRELLISIEDINTLQDLLIEQGYAIQKIKS